MQLLDELRAEHERIDAVLGALRTFTARLVRGEADPLDRALFLRFFTVYAGALHHGREEEVLLKALATEAALPSDRGPASVVLADHERMGRLLEAIAVTNDPAVLDALAIRYSHELWEHIDVENSVLFPESETQLRRAGVIELPTRALTAEEADAAATGDELVARYPPIVPDSIRGEGCVMCHAYGDGCRGLEREWWNEWMWEELDEHVASS